MGHCRAYSMRRTHHVEGCGVLTFNNQGPQILCVTMFKYQGPQKSGVVNVKCGPFLKITLRHSGFFMYCRHRPTVQGYLAHTTTPKPLGSPQDPWHRPAVGS